MNKLFDLESSRPRSFLPKGNGNANICTVCVRACLSIMLQVQHSLDRSITTYCNKCDTAGTGQLQHTVTSATQPGPVNYNIL